MFNFGHRTLFDASSFVIHPDLVLSFDVQYIRKAWFTNPWQSNYIPKIWSEINL